MEGGLTQSARTGFWDSCRDLDPRDWVAYLLVLATCRLSVSSRGCDERRWKLVPCHKIRKMDRHCLWLAPNYFCVNILPLNAHAKFLVSTFFLKDDFDESIHKCTNYFCVNMHRFFWDWCKVVSIKHMYNQVIAYNFL